MSIRWKSIYFLGRKKVENDASAGVSRDVDPWRCAIALLLQAFPNNDGAVQSPIFQIIVVDEK